MRLICMIILFFASLEVFCQSHIVRQGEKLENIVSERSGLSGYDLILEVGRISALNELGNPHHIEPGQIISFDPEEKSKRTIKTIVKKVYIVTPEKLNTLSTSFGLSRTQANWRVDANQRDVNISYEWETNVRLNYIRHFKNSDFNAGGYIGNSEFGASIGWDF